MKKWFLLAWGWRGRCADCIGECGAGLLLLLCIECRVVIVAGDVPPRDLKIRWFIAGKREEKGLSRICLCSVTFVNKLTFDSASYFYINIFFSNHLSSNIIIITLYNTHRKQKNTMLTLTKKENVNSHDGYLISSPTTCRASRNNKTPAFRICTYIHLAILPSWRISLFQACANGARGPLPQNDPTALILNTLQQYTPSRLGYLLSICPWHAHVETHSRIRAQRCNDPLRNTGARWLNKRSRE